MTTRIAPYTEQTSAHHGGQDPGRDDATSAKLNQILERTGEQEGQYFKDQRSLPGLEVQVHDEGYKQSRSETLGASRRARHRSRLQPLQPERSHRNPDEL